MSVRHALSIRISAGQSIHVARSVSGSQLVARSVIVDGKMLGDSIHAETLIRVSEAGSPAGGPCELRAAQPLEPPPAANAPSPTGSARHPSRSKLRGSSSVRSRLRAARPSCL